MTESRPIPGFPGYFVTVGGRVTRENGRIIHHALPTANEDEFNPSVNLRKPDGRTTVRKLVPLVRAAFPEVEVGPIRRQTRHDSIR